VFPILSRARTIPIPETLSQVEWVARYAAMVAAPSSNSPA